MLDWRGFELHPETPVGGLALEQLFGSRRLAAMRDHLRTFARHFGIEDMPGVDRLPNTRSALALMELAREQGRLDGCRSTAMEGFWREGLDLERERDLRTIALRSGLDADAALQAVSDPRYLQRVDALRDEARRLGVTGIPTFFFGDGPPVVGCQPYDVLARAARAAGATPRSLT